MAILKLLRGLSRMNHSFVLIKERCRNEVIGNALFPCVPFDEVDATFYATIRHDLEPTWDDWRVAAKLGRQLVANGHRLPLTDLAIAAIALRNDCSVLTTDPHFDLIAGLKRFPLK